MDFDAHIDDAMENLAEAQSFLAADKPKKAAGHLADCLDDLIAAVKVLAEHSNVSRRAPGF